MCQTLITFIMNSSKSCHGLKNPLSSSSPNSRYLYMIICPNFQVKHYTCTCIWQSVAASGSNKKIASCNLSPLADATNYLHLSICCHFWKLQTSALCNLSPLLETRNISILQSVAASGSNKHLHLTICCCFWKQQLKTHSWYWLAFKRHNEIKEVW